MSRNRVGTAMLAYMNQEQCWSICVMDGAMNEITFDLDPPLALWKGMNPHPMNRAQVAASYLARDDRFEIGRFHAHDTRGRERLLRLFKAKSEWRESRSQAGTTARTCVVPGGIQSSEGEG